MAALRLVGSLTESEVQAQADVIINQQQEAEGLVATFCHEDDGEVPCSILAVSPGEGELEPSLYEDLVCGRVKSAEAQGVILEAGTPETVNHL